MQNETCLFVYGTLRQPVNHPIPSPEALNHVLTSWLVPILVALLTSVSFLPVLGNEFVDWDDYKMLVENPHYRGLSWHRLRWMFTTFHMGHYQPLTWVTFALDYLLWGTDPFGYHLTNLLIHAANAVLFYFVGHRLLSVAGSVPTSRGYLLSVSAAFAALLFGVHPLRVESVAWATERRDVLAGFFFLGTILGYLRANSVPEGRQARRQWLLAAVILYFLSLLSKASGITLPIVMLILDVYPLRRLGGQRAGWLGPAARRVWWEKVPFLLLAVTFAIVALIAQESSGALKAVGKYDLLQRIAQAGFGLAFYLWKFALPWGLSPLYELPVELNPFEWSYVASGFLVLVISVCLYLVKRRWAAGVAIWIYYVVVLFPVLGFAQSGPQLVADRYSYLSCMGWALLGGAGLHLCRGDSVGAKFKGAAPFSMRWLRGLYSSYAF